MTMHIMAVQRVSVRALINSGKKVFLAFSFVLHCSLQSAADDLSSVAHYGHSEGYCTPASPCRYR